MLIDTNGQGALRLVPVKVDLFRARVAGYDGREFVRDFADLPWIGTAHAILQRPADRRPQFKRRQTSHDAGNFSITTASRRLRTRSRASRVLVTITDWAKKSLASCTSSGR